MESINALASGGKIQKKQDFCVIKRIIEEMEIFDKFTNKNLLDIIEQCTLRVNLVPSESSLKVISFSDKEKHPNWKLIGEDATEARRLVELAQAFQSVYNSLMQ